MSAIREYIEKNLMDPLQYYPTAIQNTLLTIIADRLEELYNLAVAFPEIVTPSESRLDILKVIADQFLFSIRDDAKLKEQLSILENVLYVYNKRGSIDSIENMWLYYGGTLPKDVRVDIPAYRLFTWNISSYDRTHVFEDGVVNTAGVYNIIVNNSNYDISELKTFVTEELVTAGTSPYFQTISHFDILQETTDTYFKYLIPHGIQVSSDLLALVYCTPEDNNTEIIRDLINEDHEKLVPQSYFVLGMEGSLLGTINYDKLETV